MSKNTKTAVSMDPFQAWCHRWGRVGTVIALVYMIAIPFIVLAYYDSVPSLGEVINLSTVSILLIYIPVGFSEALSYTPILGCSAYLTFITGNIMNLKLPCAANAMKLAGREPNTPEGEAISSVAVAVCSIMTIIILALAALLSTWIMPVFELPAVKTASEYLIPALFGSLTLGLFASTNSGQKVVKNGIAGVVHPGDRLHFGARRKDSGRRLSLRRRRFPDPVYAADCHHLFPDHVEEGDHQGGRPGDRRIRGRTVDGGAGRRRKTGNVPAGIRIPVFRGKCLDKTGGIQ